MARRRRELAEVWWALLSLGIAASFLMFRPSALLWRYAPKLGFMQFPWRWLEALAVVFAFFLAAAIGLIRQRWASGRRLPRFSFSLASPVYLIARDTWWDDEDVPFLAGELPPATAMKAPTNMPPTAATATNCPAPLPMRTRSPRSRQRLRSPKLILSPASVVGDAGMQIKIAQWTSERKNFAESSAKPVTLALRLVNYPAWEVRVDGVDATAGAANATAQMLLPLPQGSIGWKFVFAARGTAPPATQFRFSRAWACLDTRGIPARRTARHGVSFSGDRMRPLLDRSCAVNFFSPLTYWRDRVAVAIQLEFVGGQAFEPHGAARVQLAVADAQLGAEAVAKPSEKRVEAFWKTPAASTSFMNCEAASESSVTIASVWREP